MLKFKLLVALSAVLGLAAISSAQGISFIGGKAMMPLQSLKDHFGVKIAYNNRHGIGIKLDYHTVLLRPGYRQARYGKRNIRMDSNVVIINGVTYVPVSLVRDAFGYNYNWNDRQQRMTFTNRGKKRVVIDRDYRFDDRDRDECDHRDGRRNDRDCDRCENDRKDSGHYHGR